MKCKKKVLDTANLQCEQHFLINVSYQHETFLPQHGLQFGPCIQVHRWAHQDDGTESQSAVLDHVVCAFGILQKRWAIIRHAARLWDRKELEDIIMVCIILHNMIIEDERNSYQLHQDDTYEEGWSTRPITGLDHGPIHGFSRILEINDTIHDKEAHKRLQSDLVEHIWQKFGGQQT